MSIPVEVDSRNNRGNVKLLLAHLLGDREVVAFRQPLARELGALPALFLSQACYWQGIAGPGKWWFKLRDAKRNDQGKMIPPTALQQSWEWELGMTRSEQESARRILCELKLLEVRRAGTPAKLYFRVNLDELEKYLLGNQQIAGFCQQDGETAPTSGDDLPDKLENLLPANTKSASKTIQKITTTTGRPIRSGMSNLIFEPAIIKFKQQLIKILQDHEINNFSLAQELLDELSGSVVAGQRGERTKIGSPPGWFREIVSQSRNEKFDRVYCLSVQACRADQQRATNRTAAEMPHPGSKVVAREHLDRLLKRSG